jgi:hypothetical protein
MPRAHSPTYRTIIESQAVSATIDAADQDAKHAYLGLQWRLARDPGLGAVKLHDAPWWVAKSRAFARAPSLRVLYTFDDDTVELKALEILPRS